MGVRRYHPPQPPQAMTLQKQEPGLEPFEARLALGLREYGLTQDHTADLLGTSPGVVHHVERGESPYDGLEPLRVSEPTGEDLDDQQLVNTAEMAERLGVSKTTVQAWAREERIPSWRPSPQANYLFVPSDVMEALRDD